MQDKSIDIQTLAKSLPPLDVHPATEAKEQAGDEDEGFEVCARHFFIAWTQR